VVFTSIQSLWFSIFRPKKKLAQATRSDPITHHSPDNNKKICALDYTEYLRSVICVWRERVLMKWDKACNLQHPISPIFIFFTSSESNMSSPVNISDVSHEAWGRLVL
jgi:hypothetical protein